MSNVLAKAIVGKVINHLEGLRGFDHWWEGDVDADIQSEILNALTRIVAAELPSASAPTVARPKVQIVSRPPCPSTLRITADTAVLCTLPADHAQHAYPGGVDNPEPTTHHQGVMWGRVYVWTTNDAGVINTLRNAGFHAQCDRQASGLAVVVAP